MNSITKRVPREPDVQMLEVGEQALREFGICDDPVVLRRIASTVFQSMASKAPIDPVEVKLEEIYASSIEGRKVA